MINRKAQQHSPVEACEMKSTQGAPVDSGWVHSGETRVEMRRPTPQEPVTRGGEEEEHAKHQASPRATSHLVHERAASQR